MYMRRSNNKNFSFAKSLSVVLISQAKWWQRPRFKRKRLYRRVGYTAENRGGSWYSIGTGLELRPDLC